LAWSSSCGCAISYLEKSAVRSLLGNPIKAKAVPLHATKALGGDEVWLLLILYLGTLWGEWLASRPGRALAEGKVSPVPIVQEAGLAPELVWTQRLEEKFSFLCRRSNVDCSVVQPVARHYFFPEGRVGLVPKRGCLLFTLAYYAFPRWYEFGERRWNDIDRGKPKNSEKNLSQCHFVNHKSHTDWPGREPGPPRWWGRRLTTWAMAWHGPARHYTDWATRLTRNPIIWFKFPIPVRQRLSDYITIFTNTFC
jgi:hypothetical protein